MLKDWTLFEKSWLLISTLVITALALYWQSSLIGLVASITGILCVVLVAKGKISSYYFGIVQAATYGYLCFDEYNLKGEGYLNLGFYLPLQFIGLYLWMKHKKKTQDEVINGEDIYARRLSAKQWGIMVILIFVGFALTKWFLTTVNSSMAGLDGLAVVLSVFAQILMIMRFAEQWILWIVINVITVALWAVVLFQTGGNDYTVLAMWIAFLVNSICGYINWLRISKQNHKAVQHA